MSKRKAVRFAEEEERGPSDKTLLKQSAKRRPGDQTIVTESDGYDIAPGPSVGDETKSVKKYKSKHTLDSDEEEEDNTHQLNVDDVEGQEDATIDFDDQTKITPFNMREELEEGYYDAEENFVFKKDKQEIKDAWLDNIDWAKIKKEAGSFWNKDNDENPDEPSTPVDRTEIYRGILQFMQPGETITKALKRLGGNRNTTTARQQRWKEKKDKNVEENKVKNVEENVASEVQQETSVGDKNAEDVIKMTECVDKLVSEGEFEIYGFTYEKLKYEVEKRDNLQKFRDGLSKKAEISNEDDELDMFADNLDKGDLEKNSKPSVVQEVASSSKEELSENASDSVTWEFKWSNDDGIEIFGPCTSEQMQKWVEDGYFKDGVWVRRCGQSDAKFYTSKRIDFELYI